LSRGSRSGGARACPSTSYTGKVATTFTPTRPGFRIEGLLAELAHADTEAARDAVEAQLRSERGRLATLRSALQGLERRVNLSRVSLRIESGSPDIGDDDSWGVSDAFDDAGRIPGIAAGGTLIGLAILAPLALLAALAWLGGRAWRRHHREGALD
jgi:hypothetical protein